MLTQDISVMSTCRRSPILNVSHSLISWLFSCYCATISLFHLTALESKLARSFVCPSHTEPLWSHVPSTGTSITPFRGGEIHPVNHRVSKRGIYLTRKRLSKESENGEAADILHRHSTLCSEDVFQSQESEFSVFSILLSVYPDSWFRDIRVRPGNV